MTEDLDQTYVGKTPAGPKDERDFLVRFATSLARARTTDLDDKEVVYSVSDVLDRANFMLESSVDLTVLGGAEGIFVNGRRYDLESEKPEVADELQKGFPARGLAGITISGALDQNEVRAFLSAWKLVPSGSPKSSLARVREVLEMERSGHGLADPSPIELVTLPADGKLPVAAVPKSPPKPPAPPKAKPKLKIDLGEGEEPVLGEEDSEERKELGTLAKEAKATERPEGPVVPANRTLVKKSSDVIAEDVASAKKREAPPGPSSSNSSWVAKGGSGVAKAAWVEGSSSSTQMRSWLDDAASSEQKARNQEDAAAEYRDARVELDMPTGGTIVGTSSAGPFEEREVVVLLGMAFKKRKTLDEQDREMTNAVAALLDRANFVIQSSGEVAILFGPSGVFVNEHRFDLVRTHPEAAKELAEGAPARNLAGFSFTGVLEPGEVKALLSAWKVNPSGSAKVSFSRFREVWEGERQGYGLSDQGPVEVIPLPADGRLPAPEDAVDVTASADAGESAAKERALADRPPERTPEKLTPAKAASKPPAEKAPEKASERPSEKPRPRAAPTPPPQPKPKPPATPPPQPKPVPSQPKAAPPPKPKAPPQAEEGNTIVGAKVAGPGEERDLLALLGTAFAKRRTLDESDRELTKAIAALLDRANFVVDSAGGGVTLLMGAPGVYVENRRYDLTQKNPTAAKELMEGAPARMIAGFQLSGVVDQSEVKALLSAWKVNPSGSPKAAYARFREVWDGERQGFGLPEEGPIGIIQLFADGKLPVPGDAIDISDDDDDDLTTGEPDPEVEKKASGTAVRPLTEVIGEDLEHRASSSAVRKLMKAAKAAPESGEEEKSDTSVGKASNPGAAIHEEDFSAEDLLNPAKTPVKVERPRAPSVDDLSPEAARAMLAYARLASRSARAFAVQPQDAERALSAMRRAVVEVLRGLDNTYFEDRLIAVTAFPGVASDARARHAANTAIFAALAGRSLGIARVQLADLVVAAALHDDGDIETAGKADRWPRTLVRVLEGGSVSDLTILRAVLAYERAGPRAAVARPVPNQKRPRLESRIVACACAYDEAIASTRPDLALERLASAGHDPTAARALANGLGKYPRGTVVQLASGTVGVVLACGRRADQPRVRIVSDADGGLLPAREIELAQSQERIQKVEDPAHLGLDPRAHLVAWG